MLTIYHADCNGLFTKKLGAGSSYTSLKMLAETPIDKLDCYVSASDNFIPVLISSFVFSLNEGFEF